MLLAIDTATNSIGIALHDGNQLISEHHWISQRYHTVQLAPEIALMLRRSEKSASGLTALAVARGPGSYTGLRIGMALAKGLALAHNLNKKVVAEGVESDDHLKVLDEIKCDFTQGFLFAKPMDSDMAEDFIREFMKELKVNSK